MGRLGKFWNSGLILMMACMFSVPALAQIDLSGGYRPNNAEDATGNPDIGDFIDALYFTVGTLTTTGFGDITLTGDSGRLLSVAIMVIGVVLFLRLAQALFRPKNLTITCGKCGLERHEPDAIHCRRCGRALAAEEKR